MFERLLSDRRVTENYVKAGRFFGLAVSYIYMGEPVGFEKMLRNWGKWEAEYARRGYRTISLDVFIESGGYGRPVELSLLGVRRNPGEEPAFHAKIYREEYLGKVGILIDPFETLAGKIQFGIYELPSTEEHAGESRGKKKKTERKTEAREH